MDAPQFYGSCGVGSVAVRRRPLGERKKDGEGEAEAEADGSVEKSGDESDAVE